jgi:hypothetical protein
VEGLRPNLPAAAKKTKFWNAYKTVADEYDKEYTQKYSTDLDASLIFVRIMAQMVLVPFDLTHL